MAKTTKRERSLSYTSQPVLNRRIGQIRSKAARRG